jgi:hypothetical protein
LAALAGAMCTDGERRLAAAMFEAGLAGERGLAIWRSRHGAQNPPVPLLECMHGMRSEIFRLVPPRIRPPQPEPGALFADAIMSPLRIFCEGPAWLDFDRKRLVLEWAAGDAKPSVFQMLDFLGIEILPIANLPRFRADRTLNQIDVRYMPGQAGPCRAWIDMQAGSATLPNSSLAPRYVELRN